MKPSLEKNVAVTAATFNSNESKTQQIVIANISKDSQNPKLKDTNISEGSQNLKYIAVVNSNDRSKFVDLSVDEKVKPMSFEEKKELIFSIDDQIEGLEKQVEETKEWVIHKVEETGMKQIKDQTKLQTKKTERVETQKLIKGKLMLHNAIGKRMAYVANIWRSTTVELKQAHGYLSGLETQNAEIKAEMEACKLSASETNTASLQITKREKKALKKARALEKQSAKLQLELSKEKKKTSELEELLTGIKQCRKEAEAKLKEELKATKEAKALLIIERLLKEAIEAKIDKKREEASMKMEINFQCHNNNVRKLEQEISSTKAAAQAAKQQQESTIPPSQSEPEEELKGGRKCIVCNTNEVSILLLPCAHQVMCVTCCDKFKCMLRVGCPICLTPVQQMIRVFGGSSY